MIAQGKLGKSIERETLRVRSRQLLLSFLIPLGGRKTGRLDQRMSGLRLSKPEVGQAGKKHKARNPWGKISSAPTQFPDTVGMGRKTGYLKLKAKWARSGPSWSSCLSEALSSWSGDPSRFEAQEAHPISM